MSQEQAMLIEELAANAWPAAVQQQLDGWRLRASGGVTRRANSVLARGPFPTYPGWPVLVAEFYARHKLPPRYQISAAAPTGLDSALHEQGYSVEAPTAVQTASCQAVLDHAAPLPGYEIVPQDRLQPDWLAAFLAISEQPVAKHAVYAGIMRAIGPATCFVQVRDGSTAVGIGLAVAERGWAGLLDIATAPDRRGLGIGTAVVRALAAWSATQGANELYLQVAQENAVALRLYRRLGFHTAYTYHYRVQHPTSVAN